MGLVILMQLEALYCVGCEAPQVLHDGSAGRGRRSPPSRAVPGIESTAAATIGRRVLESGI